VARPVGQRLLGARRQDDAAVQVLLGDPLFIVLRRRQLGQPVAAALFGGRAMMPRQCASFFSARSADRRTTQRWAASGWKAVTPSSMAFSMIQSILLPSGRAWASVTERQFASRAVWALISALALRFSTCSGWRCIRRLRH
jgi:hypothetical protein